jgi:hypothetical protein
MDIISVFETEVPGSSPGWKANTMKKDCFYKVTVTREDFDGSYYFPKRVETWWLGRFNWREVQAHVEEWYYVRGADAVELEQITEEEFYEQMPRCPHS